MQPRSLEAVLSSLNSVYDPQINNIRARQSAIPGQIAEEEKGLGAKQERAFGDILGGARRRGLGFSGIPLEEQAKYTSTEYLPALAKLRQSGREQAMSLEDAILGINERRNSQGQSIYQWENQQAEARRQFDEQQKLAREQMAAQQRAAAAAAARPTFGGGGGEGASKSPTNPMQQDVYNDVKTRVSRMSPEQLKSDYQATARSAGYGNVRDKYKLEFYAALMPDLFRNPDIRVLANGGQLRY